MFTSDGSEICHLNGLWPIMIIVTDIFSILCQDNFNVVDGSIWMIFGIHGPLLVTLE